jgi:hypothetical protein
MRRKESPGRGPSSLERRTQLLRLSTIATMAAIASTMAPMPTHLTVVICNSFRSLSYYTRCKICEEKKRARVGPPSFRSATVWVPATPPHLCGTSTHPSRANGVDQLCCSGGCDSCNANSGDWVLVE